MICQHSNYRMVYATGNNRVGEKGVAGEKTAGGKRVVAEEKRRSDRSSVVLCVTLAFPLSLSISNH